jgi:NADH dehydrogenase FAD-containing subunit
VTPELRVDGFDHVYAVGDIAALGVNKAAVASRQASVVAADITAQIEGSDEHTTLYGRSPSIILPSGPTGGAGELGTTGEIISAEYVSKIKGADVMIDQYAEMLNLPPANA